jgi:hypothetical protein
MYERPHGSLKAWLSTFTNNLHIAVVKNEVLYIDGGVQKWNGTDIKPGNDTGVFGISKSCSVRWLPALLSLVYVHYTMPVLFVLD